MSSLPNTIDIISMIAWLPTMPSFFLHPLGCNATCLTMHRHGCWLKNHEQITYLKSTIVCALGIMQLSRVFVWERIIVFSLITNVRCGCWCGCSQLPSFHSCWHLSGWKWDFLPSGFVFYADETKLLKWNWTCFVVKISQYITMKWSVSVSISHLYNFKGWIH